jgi:ATP-dependent exoDNAse (exonuclease V) beta subunit
MNKTQFSPEQEEVISTWGQGMAVLAGAGSGKTTTLVAKCVRLIEKNPDAKFAAVSFTERSASDLRAKLSLALSQLFSHTGLQPRTDWIMTIHGLCRTVIKEFPKEAGLDGEEAILSEPEALILWKRSLDSLWLESLPDEIRTSLEFLLDRESRSSLSGVLERVRKLAAFGALKHLTAAPDLASKHLVRVASYVIDRYERLKRRQGRVDFDDLEKGADRALEFPHVRESYRKRFDLVLVDEFQDTNPIQSRIITRFVKQDFSNLVVVGDPKQSIYRFRDADVSVFEEFCSRLPLRFSLTWNFRSRPEIIEFANQVCAQAFAASELGFEALIPKREPSPDLESVLRFDLGSPEDLGAWIQSEMKRGVPLHEFALLVRKIRGNEKWFRALTAAKIPIAIGSGGLFWEDPRVREMVAFLKWWDHPGNSYSGAVFLRAPWMKIPDTVLDTWIQEDPTWAAPFFSSHHAIAEALKPYRKKISRPGELLLALLIDDETEGELGAPLLGLWHRVEDMSSRGMDFHSIVLELARAISENRREIQVPAPRNLGQLTILTLHGSKGLEFPHVILIDFGPKPRASDTPLLFWDRDRGVFFAGRDSDGNRLKDHPIERVWREDEKKKNLAESKRLFYVALTRARERLILVCPEIGVSKVAFQPDVAFKQEDWRAWIECSNWNFKTAKIEEPSTAVRPGRAHPPQLERHYLRESPPLARPRHSVTELNLLARCPRAYEWTHIRPRLSEAPELSVSTAEPEQDSEIAVTVPEKTEASSEVVVSKTVTYRELGSRIHSCLERRDFDGLREIEKEVGAEHFVADPVIRWAEGSPSMKLADPVIGRDVWSELSFEAPLGQEVMVGSIDRVVSVQQGNRKFYTILDFKFSEKRKSSWNLLEAYQGQMEWYAWALTVLDPEVLFQNIQAELIVISPEGVQSVRVTLGKQNLPSILNQAVQIVRGAQGSARPGPLCRMCGFKSMCEEGETYLKERTHQKPLPQYQDLLV